MLVHLIRKIFGSKNDRQVKKLFKIVGAINALESSVQSLSDEELKAKTNDFKQRYKSGETLDDLLVEAFAVCREGSVRMLGMRHFDVQLMGGLALHNGKIAEMRTGEGKTLVATLPAYLNAISSKGVHLVTVNDYLAKRDANLLRPLYEFLGLSVGIIVPMQGSKEKNAAYQCDVTYGTNNEFGFDYLRDNMVYSIEDKCQRDLNFAIVDEVDSILIDEARTPLIISGPTEDLSALYKKIKPLVLKLKPYEQDSGDGESSESSGDYQIDEKLKQVELTESGHQYIEELLTKSGLLPEGESLYSSSNLNLLHHVNAGLKANVLFHNEVDYINTGNEIVLIDEHTGRSMPGRRLSEGLHQALEAKENVNIQAESQTLGSTTFQNYFRMYDNLSGMTGTADTEAFEFRQIYNLDVVVMPTNKPMIRKDYNDLVFLSLQDKYQAVIDDINEAIKKGRPILVGTASIESSEFLSEALKKAKIPHRVLNAKFHMKEAEIISQAGCPSTVTIATNMAGRGTDIILGGNWQAEIDALNNPTESEIESIKTNWQERHDKVVEAGGLHIIGTERHESRRIDNQLRGRSGRQGDPGSARFYLSLEDNLMRIFASDKVKTFMKAMGMEKGESIEHRMVTNAIEKAQRKVEGRNFDIRKQLLEYDDVANEQRKIVYCERDELLVSESFSDRLSSIRESVIRDVVEQYMPDMSHEEQWDISNLTVRIRGEFAMDLPITKWVEENDELMPSDVVDKITKSIKEAYTEKGNVIGSENLYRLEQHILLSTLDDKWKEQLATMDHLRRGIHLRGFAAKNPKQEYKREGFHLFQQMLTDIKSTVIRVLSHVEIEEVSNEDVERKRREEEFRNMTFRHGNILVDSDSNKQSNILSDAKPFVRDDKKIGRNQECPCGSGKKYKHCHGKP